MRFHLAGCLLLAAAAYADSSLDPPGLRPLVNRGNVLLSSGQFNEASRVFSDAIGNSLSTKYLVTNHYHLDLSPADYLLYYKRATAYFSMHRHPYALEDFNKVLHLTSNTFSNAHLMIARINARDGHFDAARDSLAAYSKTNKGSTETAALLVDIDEAEKATTNTWGTRDAQLWSACVENASQALKIASHSIEIRQTRAECALASGDVEGAVGDFTYVGHHSVGMLDVLITFSDV
jgi:DnaJ family protein C protein 3